MYRGATKWNALAAGTSGEALTTQGAGADPIWGSPTADISPAVILLPTSSARNVIQPSGAAVIPLTVKGFASQSATLQEWQDSAANVLGSISASGLSTNTVLDAATSTSSDVQLLGHNSSGTPAAGFASRTGWRLHSTTTVNTEAAELGVSWVVATHASRTARAVLSVYDTAAREVLRGQASGTAPMIGFLGASAVVRPASTTDLRQALIDLGLYTTGGASPLNLNGGAFVTSGSVSSTGAGASSERFGAGALAGGISSTSVGNAASASTQQCTAIGATATASNTACTALGFGAVASAVGSTALGFSANSAFGSSIAIGTNSVATAIEQCIIGGTTASGRIATVYIGNGVVNAAPSAVTINGTGGSGTDIAGASLTIAGGRGTGSAVGGAIIFQSTAAGASATTLRTLEEKFRISNLGVLTSSRKSSTQDRTVVDMEPTFVVATDASRTGRAVWCIYDTAAREAMRMEASGSAPMIGFLGAAAVARTAAYTPTNVSADRSYDANATTLDEVADVLGTLIADLQLFGFLA